MNTLLLSIVLAAPVPKFNPEYELALSFLSGRMDYGDVTEVHEELQKICNNKPLAMFLLLIAKPPSVTYTYPYWTITGKSMWDVQGGDRYFTLHHIHEMRNVK